jgi:hypothetical protein
MQERVEVNVRNHQAFGRFVSLGGKNLGRDPEEQSKNGAKQNTDCHSARIMQTTQWLPACRRTICSGGVLTAVLSDVAAMSLWLWRFGDGHIAATAARCAPNKCQRLSRSKAASKAVALGAKS